MVYRVTGMFRGNLLRRNSTSQQQRVLHTHSNIILQAFREFSLLLTRHFNWLTNTFNKVYGLSQHQQITFYSSHGHTSTDFTLQAVTRYNSDKAAVAILFL